MRSKSIRCMNIKFRRQDNQVKKFNRKFAAYNRVNNKFMATVSKWLQQDNDVMSNLNNKLAKLSKKMDMLV